MAPWPAAVTVCFKGPDAFVKSPAANIPLTFVSINLFTDTSAVDLSISSFNWLGSSSLGSAPISIKIPSISISI